MAPVILEETVSRGRGIFSAPASGDFIPLLEITPETGAAGRMMLVVDNRRRPGDTAEYGSGSVQIYGAGTLDLSDGYFQIAAYEAGPTVVVASGEVAVVEVQMYFIPITGAMPLEMISSAAFGALSPDGGSVFRVSAIATARSRIDIGVW